MQPMSSKRPPEEAAEYEAKTPCQKLASGPAAAEEAVALGRGPVACMRHAASVASAASAASALRCMGKHQERPCSRESTRDDGPREPPMTQRERTVNFTPQQKVFNLANKSWLRLVIMFYFQPVFINFD